MKHYHALLQFPYIALPYWTKRYQYWIYRSICQDKPIKSIIMLYTNNKISSGWNTQPSKSWVFKSSFFFKVGQHGQQQLNLQYKVCWILHLYIQPLAQCPSPTFTYFTLFPKPYLHFPQILPLSITQQLLSSLFLHTAIPTIFYKSFYPTLTISQFRLHQVTKEQGSLVRTDTVLISSWFSVLKTEITAVTVTDSLAFRLWKSFYCK